MPGSYRALVKALPLIIPLAVRWVQQQEKLILRTGIALSKNQIDDARQSGVCEPEKIRIAFVEAIPIPHGFLLGPLSRLTGLVSTNTAGITLGYGIYIRRRYSSDRGLLVHECVHVGQYERLGSIKAFLRDYLRECLDPGYPMGPLEQEAIQRAREIVGRS